MEPTGRIPPGHPAVTQAGYGQLVEPDVDAVLRLGRAASVLSTK